MRRLQAPGIVDGVVGYLAHRRLVKLVVHVDQRRI